MARRYFLFFCSMSIEQKMLKRFPSCKSIKKIDDLFTFIRPLGTGANGTVYLAHVKHPLPPFLSNLPDVVAIKTITKFSAETLNEIKILERLNLPHSCAFYGCYVTDATLYLVMEYIEGRELYYVINDDLRGVDRLTLGQKENIAFELYTAIKEFHDQGMTHHDIKPENIMIKVKVNLDSQIDLKLVDYGFVCDFRPGSNPFCDERSGTPAYMDFRAQGNDWASMKRADWWAYGQILLLLFTGTSTQLFDETTRTVSYTRIQSLKGIPLHMTSMLLKLTDPTLAGSARPDEEDIFHAVRPLRSQAKLMRELL
jgi:serine/threonine protein kinase